MPVPTGELRMPSACVCGHELICTSSPCLCCRFILCIVVLARQGFMSMSSWESSDISSQPLDLRGTARSNSMPFPGFRQPAPKLCKQPQPVRIWTDYVDNLAEQQV